MRSKREKVPGAAWTQENAQESAQENAQESVHETIRGQAAIDALTVVAPKRAKAADRQAVAGARQPEPGNATLPLIMEVKTAGVSMWCSSGRVARKMRYRV